MVQKDWYQQLATSDRLIVEVRKHIQDVTAQISSLEQQQRTTRKVVARLQLFELTRGWLLEHRAVVLKQMRAHPLPE
jgi:N-methylhydantoinase B/oxoprolinase/acetone carboxylase alpha subunit